jgi:hypothetical protein
MKHAGWAVLVLAINASVVAAQTDPRVSAFVAGSFVAAQRDFTPNGITAFRSQYDNGGKVGLRFTADLDNHWAAEASYSFGRNNLRVKQLDPPRSETKFETDLHQFEANASYYFEAVRNQWRPFVTFGLGFSRFSPTEKGQDTALQRFINQPARLNPSTRFGINFGAGVEGKLNNWFGVRADLKDHVVPIPRYGLPQQPLNAGGVFYPVQGSLQNIEAAVGAVFHFR